MRSIVTILLAGLFTGLTGGPVSGQTAPEDQDTLRFVIRAQLIVSDRGDAARSLSDWAESVGGFFLLRSEERVVMRVPSERRGDLATVLEQTGEELVSFSPSASDMRRELAEVNAAITSREEALELVLSYLDDADVSGTLALEREIQSLIQSLEQLKGRRRRLLHEAAFARAEVLLQSPAQTIPTQRPSAFPWVNDVDLYEFLERSR